MTRALMLGSFWVVLSGAGLVIAQEPPPLEPPSLEGPQTTPKGINPPQIPPPAAQTQVRPLLVIPGVTAPVRSSSTIPRPRSVQPTPVASPSGTISLDRPVTGGGSLGPGRPALPQSRAPASSVGVTIPLTIEPLEDEPANKAGAPKGAREPAVVERPTLRSLADEKPPIAPLADEPAPEAPPRRSPTFFGRFLGPAATTPPARTDLRSAAAKTRSGADAPADPTTDAAARKRIEREINDALGDRLRSLEVRVSGRNVLIVARASRFWQKRSLRRTLETLPGLAGYRARIDVPD